MRKLIAALFGLVLVISMSAQNSSDRKKLTRAEKKEIRTQERAALRVQILEAIEERSFAIEAYTLEDRYGRFIQVSPVTNFIAIDSNEATIQFALPNRIGGPNGLGGITDEGRVRNIKVADKPSKHGVSFEMDVTGPVFGSSRVYVDVNSEGLAIMRFSGAFGAKFTMRGNFERLEESNLYKGVARF